MFNEAKNIYMKLIKEGTRNHLVFGNLAIIYGLKEEYNEMFEDVKTKLKDGAALIHETNKAE